MKNRVDEKYPFPFNYTHRSSCGTNLKEMKMKKAHKSKASQYMSSKAFQAHINRQCDKFGETASALFETDQQAFIDQAAKYPLGFISAVGLFGKLSKQDSANMSAVAFEFHRQFGKFTNIETERFVAAMLFIAEFEEELKSEPAHAAVLKNEFYEWIYDQSADIDTTLKDRLDMYVNHLKARKELETLNRTVAKSTPQKNAVTTFKV